MHTKAWRIACVLLFLSSSALAQQVNSCGFKIPPQSLFRNNFQSVYEAKAIVEEMLDTIRWKENFTLREQNGINNAYATIINNRRWIIYDNHFLENIDAHAATKWASISIMAHEMGHHYYNHVVSGKGSTVPTEIQADYFSGYVMSRLGAALPQSVAAIQAVASDRASATHPAKKDRVDAITRGWNAGRAATAGNNSPGNTSANPTPPGSGNNPTNPPGNTGAGGGNTPAPPATTPDNDPSWINLTVLSDKAQTFALSDDGRRFEAVTINAGEPFVFKFEIYKYGWLRLPYYNGTRTFRLMHGKDYCILWNRRKNVWTVVEVPE
jgi:hypothetical protein